MREIGLTILVVLAVVAVAPGPVGGQSVGYTVSVTLPADFAVGENAIEVTVDNTNGSTELFSPVIEVPLGSSLNVTDPAPTVEVGGSDVSRTWQVINSTYRDGTALYVYGQEVPAGEARTYAFSLDVEEAGNRTVEADVSPLYNQNVHVRGSASAVASGLGSLHARVIEPDGSPAPGAAITVDGTDHGGDVSVSLVEGEHTITANVTGMDFPALDVTLDQFEEENVTFVRQTDLSDPRVIAFVGDQASVAANTIALFTTDNGNATHPRRGERTFLLDADGPTVVGVADPPDIDAVTSRQVTVSNGDVEGTSVSGDVLLTTVDASATTDVTVEYVGLPVGDADGDGAVSAVDARTIAAAVAGTGSTNAYADIDGDGRVTAVDAMFVAQYAAGNRTADYGGA